MSNVLLFFMIPKGRRCLSKRCLCEKSIRRGKMIVTKNPNMLYDLQGRRIIGQPKHGVYIGNENKVIFMK